MEVGLRGKLTCVGGASKSLGRGFGRIINITSSAVKASMDDLGLSNGARSGLTGFAAEIARKTVAATLAPFSDILICSLHTTLFLE